MDLGCSKVSLEQQQGEKRVRFTACYSLQAATGSRLVGHVDVLYISALPDSFAGIGIRPRAGHIERHHMLLGSQDALDGADEVKRAVLFVQAQPEEGYANA